MSTDNKPSSAGDLLRQGRLRQRLSIDECAKRTHISPRFIAAIEEEHWENLPSESHRLGFLRLYSRFLGVSSEEVLALYRQNKPEHPDSTSQTPMKAAKPERQSQIQWYPSTWQQLVAVVVLLLLAAWGLYHSMRKYMPEQTMGMPTWVRLRPQQSRLIPSNKPTTTIQRVRVKAQADSWLRVVENRQLLFEGILPNGASKDWSGPGPFQLKFGNPQAVTIYWNDQPVDITSGAHGSLNELQLPLNK